MPRKETDRRKFTDNKNRRYHEPRIPPPHLHQTSLMSTVNHNIIDPNHHHLESIQSNTQHTHSLGGTSGQMINDFGLYVDDQPPESELKLSKNDICTPCNCICLFIAFILLFIVLMTGIYYGCKFFLLILLIVI